MWISVNDKLPVPMEDVLVVVENEGTPEVVCSYYDELYLTWDDDDNEIMKPRWYYNEQPLYSTNWYQEVTFWMPLPELPEQYT